MDIYYWGGKRGGFWRKPGGFRLFGSGNTAIQYYWDMLLSDCFSAVSAVSTQLWNQKALLLIFICFRIDANEEDIEFGRVKKNGGRVSPNYFIFVLAHSKSSFALKILVEEIVETYWFKSLSKSINYFIVKQIWKFGTALWALGRYQRLIKWISVVTRSYVT